MAEITAKHEGRSLVIPEKATQRYIVSQFMRASASFAHAKIHRPPSLRPLPREQEKKHSLDSFQTTSIAVATCHMRKLKREMILALGMVFQRVKKKIKADFGRMLVEFSPIPAFNTHSEFRILFFVILSGNNRYFFTPDMTFRLRGK